MKNLICLILTLALLLAACGGCGEPAESGDLSTGGGSESESESTSGESNIDESQSENSKNEASSDEGTEELGAVIQKSETHPGYYEATVTAHTKFELEDGDPEPKVTFLLPDTVTFSDTGDNLKAVFGDGTQLVLGWTFLYELRDYDEYDNPLYYYENPEKSIGYISHEAVQCGDYDCIRIIAYGGHPKYDTAKTDAERLYVYEYFVHINDNEIFYIPFWSYGSSNEEAMKLQEEVVAEIKR